MDGRRVRFAKDPRCDGKGLELSAVHSARERLATAGIRACYFLQFGYPGEAWRKSARQYSLVRQTRPDDIGVSLSYPLPGTGFFDGFRRSWETSVTGPTATISAHVHTAATTTSSTALFVTRCMLRSTSWQLPLGSSDHPRCESLWHRVMQLEPVSRNINVLSRPHQSSSNGTETLRFYRSKTSLLGARRS